MSKRVEVGTDIATIGLWDPAHERHDLKNAKYADFESALRSEARSGRLFYVNTGGDCGFPVDIYVDETPGSDLLAMYSRINRDFLIVSESGRLLAGGVEDFVSARKQITSPEDQIPVPSGRYALTLHSLNHEQLSDPENLKRVVGAEDYGYYDQRSSDVPWGYLLFGIGIVILLFRLWYVAIAVFSAWVVYMIVRSRIRASDSRFQQIRKRITEYEEGFPTFIFALKRLPESADLEGGWFNLS